MLAGDTGIFLFEWAGKIRVEFTKMEISRPTTLEVGYFYNFVRMPIQNMNDISREKTHQNGYG